MVTETAPKILKHEVNCFNREFYIEKVNEPLVKAIVLLAKRYPEPTMENVLDPNCKELLRMRDKYLSWERNERIAKLVEAFIRIAVNKIEHSANYRDRASVWVELIKACNWKSRALNHPEHEWAEPKPYGGRRL